MKVKKFEESVTEEQVNAFLSQLAPGSNASINTTGSAIWVIYNHIPSEIEKDKTADEINLPVCLRTDLESFEKRYIEEAFKQSNGHATKAAELLGIDYRSFRYKYEKYGLGAQQGGQKN